MNPGTRYGDYDILREIARGSMGVVYLATRRDTGQQVALKVVFFRDSVESRENIETEKRGAELQQAIARQDHRVVVVNRVLFTNRDLNIEMEYVDGEDLFELITAGPLPADRAARIAAELCEMLCKLGLKTPPVVHGDLKPRNVRVRPGGQIKVLDFGIAKEMLRGEGTVNLFQTLRYASPERIETSVASQESDLWSVGIMLAEMVAGKHPFQSARQDDLRRRILSGVPPDVPASVPAPLRAIIFRALAFRQAQRYAGPAAMLADLRRFLNSEPVEATGTSNHGDADGDAETQRTVAEDDNATRRTVPERAAAAPLQDKSSSKSLGKSSRSYPNLRRVLIGGAAASLLVLVFLALAAVRQARAWSDASQLIDQLRHNDIDESTAWARYEAVRQEAPVKFLLFGLNAALERKLQETGEEPIKDYRNDVPTATEGDWQRAANTLARAHDIDPGDKTVLGSLRICEGHVQRIRAKVRGKKPNRKMMNVAIADFEEAARLMPNSPDPYIGLAHLYFYDQPDPEKGDQMLEEASKRGHGKGKREVLEHADGLRQRAILDEQQALRFQDLPDQEKKKLESARDEYQSAADSFEQVNDFPGRDIPAMVREVLARKQSVEERLGNITSSQISSFFFGSPTPRKVSQ